MLEPHSLARHPNSALTPKQPILDSYHHYSTAQSNFTTSQGGVIQQISKSCLTL